MTQPNVLPSFDEHSLMENEWARAAEDILWRRTKLGLKFTKDQVATLEDYIGGK